MKLEAKEFKTKVYSKDIIPAISEYLKHWDLGEGLLEVRINAPSSTINHKALFWIWMRQLAANFSNRGDEDYKPEQMHDLMCHKFLGYTDSIKIGKTVIKPALRTITYPEQLKGTDFGHFLSQIDAWCQSVGVLLITQANSEYANWKEANQ